MVGGLEKGHFLNMISLVSPFSSQNTEFSTATWYYNWGVGLLSVTALKLETEAPLKHNQPAHYSTLPCPINECESQ
jgi:hypothetical protein